jgi:hypothetical protein
MTVSRGRCGMHWNMHDARRTARLGAHITIMSRSGWMIRMVHGRLAFEQSGWTMPVSHFSDLQAQGSLEWCEAMLRLNSSKGVS